MNDKKTRARIKELLEQSLKWVDRAEYAANCGCFMDASQHLRRSNELVLQARQIEQTLGAQ